MSKKGGFSVTAAVSPPLTGKMGSPMTNAWCHSYPVEGFIASATATLYNTVVENTDSFDVAASLNGDEDAYARLVRRYEKPITGLLWRFTRDPAQCEELVQQVFVEAYFSLRTYRGDAPLLHWLRRIATRTGYRYWRQKAREPQETPLPDYDVLERIEAVEEDRLDPAEAAAVLQTLLSRLPPDDRLVLTLMYFENWGTREIAEQVGWSRAKVKTQALRARRKMKEIAEREHLLERLGWTL
jgi:RNA polymerase sigma-70 factor (ECF subfamily)